MENNDNIKKRHGFFKYGIIFLVLAIIILTVGATNYFATGNAIFALKDNANTQISTLKVAGSSYVLEPSTFKKGVPIRLIADMSQFLGCSRSVVISAFNVRKTLSPSDNVIEFLPDKAGTFTIACSMNMYRGKFMVIDSGGEKTDYVESASTVVNSCGSGSEGCGCGS